MLYLPDGKAEITQVPAKCDLPKSSEILRPDARQVVADNGSWCLTEQSHWFILQYP